MSNKFDAQEDPHSWKTRLALWRNRILGSRSFQSWAAKMPIFRIIARRKAAGQFDLIAGFVYTQITFVFVDTALIHFLNERPRNAGEVRAFLKLEPEATQRILKAGAALDLAESPQDDLWTLGEVGAALSVNDGAMAMIRHHALLYRDLANPMETLSKPKGSGGELSFFWTYASSAGHDSDEAEPYSKLMADTQPMVWEQIIGRYPFARHDKMLDIGGGSGAFIEAAGGAAPNLKLGIFDLPDVAPLAKKRFAGSALEERITIHNGSFRQDDLPTGYDLITLIRILHDHDDDVAQALLVKVCDSLPKGGRLLIVEPMAKTKGAKKMGDAYFGLYLWAMGTGRPRSYEENANMAKAAGFSGVKPISTPLPLVAKALVAVK
jgi:demethylspheroidene O-methyltransferase